MTVDIAAWILKQIGDDEQLARDAEGWGDGPWQSAAGPMGPEVRIGDDTVWSREVPSGVWCCDDYSDEEGCADARAGWMRQAEHIARWDPARVLAETAAKRRILDEHKHVPAVQQDYDQADDFGCATCHADRHCGETMALGWCDTVRLLALPYADRPGYDEACQP